MTRGATSRLRALPPFKFAIGGSIMRNLYVVLAVVLASLSSFAADDAANDANQTLNQPATRTVSGTRIRHYKNGAVPVDLSGTTIAALVPNGSGGYTVLSGSGTSSGTFTIPNVPSGFYLFQFGSQYLWTSNTVINADSISDFRSNTVMANYSTTTFTFDLVNLNSLQSTDFFEMLCPNNLSFNFYFGTVGETTFTGTFNYFGNLSDASQGDQYYIAQLATQSVGGYPLTALSRFYKPPEFTQAQGSDTLIRGNLKTIAQTDQFEANVNGADLLTQALAANPNATLFSTTFGLDVYPGSFSHGQETDTSDLVIYGGIPTLATNGDLGPVFYGNPYPASEFPLYIFYSYDAQTNYTAPGATSSTPIITVAYGTTLNLPTTTSPIKPLVNVVNSPTVKGLNFFTDQTEVGLTPPVKWSPPSGGPVTYYVVTIYQLTNSGGSTIANSIANLSTQRTSLVVPSGLLTSGQAYVFEITAYYIPTLNFAKTPYVLGSTTGRADVISGMMQP